ncbi:hypothetical protein RJ641_016318 [Dillenia turbinata]|uniref:MI domain-containing protein n=1 Tax=Dillenia turbinata TaxID=194707 RepID=A0AAN8YZ12_9MAGN
MISLWVLDSFERKEMERDQLAKLLISLAKPRDGLFSQIHLIRGFESVLNSLEDAVNDAPRAAEFLGHIFAKVVLDNVTSLKEIGQLIIGGGEEPGRLREIGLAAEVLGSILEIIRLQRGEPFLKEMRSSSNLRLEDFWPPDPRKARRLEQFI